MDSQFTASILRKCASVFTGLSVDNRRCSEQAINFYHNRMSGKAAQTYKHCAAYLLMVADKLPAIHPDRSDASLSIDRPMHRIPFRTYKRRRLPVRALRRSRATNRRYRAAIGRAVAGPAELKTCQTLICRNKS